MSHYQNFTPPFEIPDSWEWVKLEDVCELIVDCPHSTAKDEGKGYALIRTPNVGEGRLKFEGVHRVSQDVYNQRNARAVPKKADIIYAREAPAGNAAVIQEGEIVCLGQRTVLIRPFIKWINSDYLAFALLAPSSFNRLVSKATGSTVQHVNLEEIRPFHLPLPNIREQTKIVDSIHRLFNSVKELSGNTKQLLQTINTAKSKILELAMQGKLVPQDPTDEPAADMLRRVNPKAQIITDNPHSRNIPEGWCVTTLSDLCVFLSRGKSPKYSDIPNQYPVFAQKCNLKEGGISLDQARFLDEATLDKWPVKYRLKTGDVLINSTGTGTVGRTRYFDECCLGAYPFTVPDSHVSVVRSFDEINSKYLFYCLYSPNIQQYFEDNLAGSTNQKELYIDIIGSTQIVLPPVSEQQRIVLKIEKLYYVLDKIEASLQS